MTKDVIALTEQMPDPAAILAGLFAGGPDLGVQSTAGGAIIQLCTPAGHPLLSVDAGKTGFCQVSGRSLTSEDERLRLDLWKEAFEHQGVDPEVYLGTHLTLDRLVAVKVMHHFVEEDPELQSRFEREAKVVAGLRHPEVVSSLDA